MTRIVIGHARAKLTREAIVARNHQRTDIGDARRNLTRIGGAFRIVLEQITIGGEDRGASGGRRDDLAGPAPLEFAQIRARKFAGAFYVAVMQVERSATHRAL